MDREIKFDIDIHLENGRILDLNEFLAETIQENEQLRRALETANEDNHQARDLLARVASIDGPIDRVLSRAPHPLDADELMREIRRFLV
jgi:hypothetical protein